MVGIVVERGHELLLRERLERRGRRRGRGGLVYGCVSGEDRVLRGRQLVRVGLQCVLGLHERSIRLILGELVVETVRGQRVDACLDVLEEFVGVESDQLLELEVDLFTSLRGERGDHMVGRVCKCTIVENSLVIRFLNKLI